MTTTPRFQANLDIGILPRSDAAKTANRLRGCAKDRHAQLRINGLPSSGNMHWYGDLVLASHPDGTAEVCIEQPGCYQFLTAPHAASEPATGDGSGAFCSDVVAALSHLTKMIN